MTHIPLADQIVEIEKQIRDCGRRYPILVERGRLLQETADGKLARLRAVQSTLTWLETNHDWIDQVFAIMALCPQHAFQILTKRSARMRAYLSMARAHPVGLAALDQSLRFQRDNPKSDVGSGIMLQGDICHLKVWPLPNVWLGISAERQQEADARIPDLLATPAAVRFVSAEPLLGPIDLRRWMNDWGCEKCGYGGNQTKDHCPNCGWKGHAGDDGVPCPDCGELLSDYYACPECDATNETGFGPTLSGYRRGYIDWVIVGGESGPGARPMHPDWARSIRDQCVAAGVPFFFKQQGEWSWGGFTPKPGSCGPEQAGWVRLDGRWATSADDRAHEVCDGQPIVRVGKKRAGRLLDGRTWDEMPAAQRQEEPV